jgi:hypothetical protein
MKKTMVMAIVLMTMIIITASFELQLAPRAPLNIPESAMPTALYVCPAASSLFDPISLGFLPFIGFFRVLLAFALIVLPFYWGWALYQNLLKDKFNRDSFKTPWAMTKALIWAIALILLMINTPNHYRTVRVLGDNTPYVLCESNSPGVRAVRADAVVRK